MKGSKDMSSEQSLYSDDEDDYEDPINFLNLIRAALIDTRRILETLDEDGNVYNQLWEIFKMFSGNLALDLNDSYHSELD
ncbi:MAG: hypothetical protein ACK521_05670 [bacterium]|jgi:hypothetical protein